MTGPAQAFRTVRFPNKNKFTNISIDCKFSGSLYGLLLDDQLMHRLPTTCFNRERADTTLSLLSGTQALPHNAISASITSVVDICRNGCDLCERCAVMQNRTFIESDFIEQQVPTQHTVRNHNVA